MVLFGGMYGTTWYTCFPVTPEFTSTRLTCQSLMHTYACMDFATVSYTVCISETSFLQHLQTVTWFLMAQLFGFPFAYSDLLFVVLSSLLWRVGAAQGLTDSR